MNSSEPDRRHSLAWLWSSLLLIAWLGFITGQLRFWSQTGPVFVSGFIWKLSAVLFLLLSGGWLWWRQRRQEERSFSILLSPPLFVLAFVVLLASDFVQRGFSFYSSSTVRVDLILLGSILTFALIFRAEGVAARLERLRFLLSPLLLFAVQVLIATSFLRELGGRMIWSDDHPSFLYRLAMLRDNFPNIPFYNVDWNGGYNAREFFPSGVLNVFLFTWPCVYWCPDIVDPQNSWIYGLIVPYLYVFLTPWSVYFAARTLDCDREVAVVSGLLALGPALTFFEWMLKYGTLGFSLSTGLLPLAFAFSYRLALEERPPSWRDVGALLIVGSCCLVWSLSFLALLPVLILALIRFRRVFGEPSIRSGRRGKVLAFALLFACLNGPWIVTFFRESKVVTFLQLETLPGSESRGFRAPPSDEALASSVPIMTHLEHSHEKFKELLIKINPLLLVFGVLGLGLLAGGERRYLLTFTILWLLILAALGEEFKPQLELRRLLTVASFFMTIPAAVGLVSLLRLFLDSLRNAAFFRRSLGLVSLVLLLGSLALSVVLVNGVYLNRSSERYRPEQPIVDQLSAGIKQHGGAGRTVFLGFILHDLGAQSYATQDGGHIAPLPYFTGKELYASQYYHAKWSAVDPIPAEYRRRGSEGIEEFLDLINATAVVTFLPEWTKYCRSNERYREVFHLGRFRIFVRAGAASGYFVKGKGEILPRQAGSAGLALLPEAEEIVIKYRYLPRLKLKDPSLAEIRPIPAFEEELGGGKREQVYFIGLKVSKPALEAKAKIEIGFY